MSFQGRVFLKVATVLWSEEKRSGEAVVRTQVDELGCSRCRYDDSATREGAEFVSGDTAGYKLVIDGPALEMLVQRS